MSTAPYIPGLFLSYILGSIPFGYLIGRAKGVDIRELGSGNIGATNVFRSLGRAPGVITFLLDFAKGALAVTLLSYLASYTAAKLGGTAAAPSHELPLRLLCGLGALAGHSFPLFLGFRGGKGVATGAGLTVGLAPWAAAGGVLVWILVLLASRYVSLASICAAVTVAAIGWTRYGDVPPHPLLPAALTLLAALVILRHHSNIRRLIAGNENRFNFKKRS